MKRYTIDPITRLEGHGKIEIFCNDDGSVQNVYFQVPELRGFEKFCEGRPVEELPMIVCKICGVCPEAHHLASAKAVDAVFGVEIPSAAKKLRELIYAAHYIHSHIAHFYALAAPDFVVGPTASPAERNVLGVIGKVGVQIGSEVLKHRRLAQEIQKELCGHQTYCVCAIPGGNNKALSEEKRKEFEIIAKSCVDFSKFSLKIFNDVVLANKQYVDIILNGPYALNIHSMGTVDANNKVNFYDGKIRVVDTKGVEICKYDSKDYRDHIAERVESWSYLKFPYLKAKGWTGFVEGQDSGVYHATPLSRLNAADGMATPVAHEEYQKMYSTLGGKPVHATLAMHWARLVELVYASERLHELCRDKEITEPKVRVLPTNTPSEGVGSVEAPRGTLTHHYWTDSRGIVKKVNIVVGTTNNNAPITMSIKKAAMGLIKKGTVVNEGILNMIEMAFRAYDPCFSCATHSLPGNMPMIVNIRDAKGEIVQTIKRG
ncbi:MAG: F420-nonreducing hydrogenase [Bdellovibrionales bacterium RIFOXYD1_FULL_53_11]|nr:MAG: F420-nonreducing hydrogenase [Bdellovibrionales bacterium RIFOXYD1_FULL_53_11]